jgi:hypothetical protein
MRMMLMMIGRGLLYGDVMIASMKPEIIGNVNQLIL